jgi:hypothetical protein
MKIFFTISWWPFKGKGYFITMLGKNEEFIEEQEVEEDQESPHDSIEDNEYLIK